jgi:acyl-coenzyme A synthetase/AMP-(fatty) acid ligase
MKMYRPIATSVNDDALLMYTSGTTGRPKVTLSCHPIAGVAERRHGHKLQHDAEHRVLPPTISMVCA